MQVMVGANGLPNMGKYLGLWFAWCLVIAAVAGLMVGGFVGLESTHAPRAAMLAASVTFIAHGFGTVCESIWMMRPWSSSAKYLLDAALFAIGTGLVFRWLCA